MGNVVTNKYFSSMALEGHIVEIPGLGNICAEVRAKAQSRAEDVSESDIFRRKLLLTPTKEIKDALLIDCFYFSAKCCFYVRKSCSFAM